ncbi:MAG: RluA family pseudouridine synthase [Eubacteriales bacterium]|nr:RluA family pseudouridine synthase [Eubacteriales bacterium]MDD4389639.1 RluA family pseudouridine synthase [Eubacteriales bacterium]
MDKFTYEVKKEDCEYKIKDILRHNFTFSSRLRTKLKKNNAIYLNGEPTAGWIKPKEGDIISVRLPDETSDFEPQDIPILPAYEDNDLLIINKQPGYVVHPTKGQPNGTVANGLMQYMRDTGQSFKIRFVNRLDRDTSGLLIVAKNSYCQEELTKQMKINTIKKKYTALLCGLLQSDSGTINKPTGRPDPDRIERGILPVESGGYDSVTHYNVIKRFPGSLIRLDSSITVESGFSEGMPQAFDIETSKKLEREGVAYKCDGYTLCELILETGRTHQIRVHMGSVGHYVVGDTLYGGVLCEIGKKGMYEPIAARQLLHSHFLCFMHPITGQYTEVIAPVPKDIEKLCRE